MPIVFYISTVIPAQVSTDHLEKDFFHEYAALR
jgi:hypothetical protein